MAGPFFSIVTITLENARGLGATLASIAGQRFRDFEVIVVDGGSTDGTAEVVAGFASLVTRFSSERDRGIADAFNKGTAAARGTLVNYLNAGDRYLDGGVLERVWQAWQRAPFAWGFGLSKRTDPAGRIYPPRPQQLLPYRREALARGELFISHQAAFFDTAELRGLGGYDEAFQRQAMDYELMLRFSIRHEPAVLAEPLVLYDETGESARRNFEGLLAKHRARSAVLGLGPAARAADLARTVARYGAGRARHAGKRALLSFALGRAALRRAGFME